MASDNTRFNLEESAIPQRWDNMQSVPKTPAPPPLHPATHQPIGPDDLAPLFPMELIRQEVSRERYIDIPEPVQDVYRLWRPSPLFRAHRLEKLLGTPARIYYKYEGVSPAGSHKPNTAVPQAFYNQQAGIKKLVTETGAGKWGSSLAFAGSLFGIEVQVFMVRVSYDQKPYRRALMETYGARCVPSPSNETRAASSSWSRSCRACDSTGRPCRSCPSPCEQHPRAADQRALVRRRGDRPLCAGRGHHSHVSPRRAARC